MACRTPQRVLLVQKDIDADWLRAVELLGSLDAATPAGSGNDGAERLTVKCCRPREAEQRIRQASEERTPFDVAILDIEGWTAPWDAPWARRLMAMAPSMLLVLVAGPRQSVEELLASGVEPGRLVVLRRPLAPVELCQAVVAQLDRRSLDGYVCAMQVDLTTARRSLDYAGRQAMLAEQAKNEFMANVNHEIRTPMNAILGFTELLLQEPLTPEQTEKLQHVHAAGQDLLAVIEKLLDFSKLLAGDIRLKSVVFPLAGLVGEVARAVRPAAEAKGLSLEWNVDPCVPRWLRGDSAPIRKVLLALAQNAVKFTSQGSVRIQAVLDEETERTATVRLAVTDTGVGVPVERHSAVFEAFCQADGSSTRREGGLGLGLAICKHLVDLMGGQIGLRSEPGQGSCFWFTLPLEKCATPPHHSAKTPIDDQASADAPDEIPSDGRPHVLVCDADRVSRTSLEMLLSRAGCAVHLVAEDAGSLDTLRREPYDLSFVALAPAALQDPRLPSPEDGHGSGRVVILLPEGSDAAHSARLEAAGMDCLARPVDADRLLSLVHRHLPMLAEKDAGQRASSPPTFETLERVEDCLGALQGALERGDLEELESQAGQMRARAQRCGRSAAADQALRLQLASRSGDLRRVARVVHMIQLTLGGNRFDQPLAVESNLQTGRTEHSRGEVPDCRR